MEKERYATIGAFKRLFAEEGVDVCAEAIAARIREGKERGAITHVKSARLKTNVVIRERFYAESEVRAVCRDLFNRLNAEYFSDPSHILYDLTAYAKALGPDKTPLDLSTSNLSSLSVTLCNGNELKGQAYLKNAAVYLGLSKSTRHAGSKEAETLRLLLGIAAIKTRDAIYYGNKEFVLHDLNSFAQQLETDKTPLDLSTSNLRFLSITCHNGERITGDSYLRNAAVALGMAKNAREAHSRAAAIIRVLLKTAGFEITEYSERDAAYYQDKNKVLHDLTAFAHQLGPGRLPIDLNTGNFLSSSVICSNGEMVKGITYLNNAAIALGLAKSTKLANSRHSETLKLLFKIAGIKARDASYYQSIEFVLHDLNAFAQKLGSDRTYHDLTVNNSRSLSVTCCNGETVRGGVYLHNAAIALGLAKNYLEADSNLSATLRKLKEIAGLLPESTQSDD